jgi:hypothetical protein
MQSESRTDNFSNEYLKWVKESKLENLTNTQHRFAEWLLQDQNVNVIGQIGDLDTIFTDVRRFIRHGGNIIDNKYFEKKLLVYFYK